MKSRKSILCLIMFAMITGGASKMNKENHRWLSLSAYWQILCVMLLVKRWTFWFS